MKKELRGYRTLIATLVGVLALVVGMKLVHPEKRHEVFVFFSGGIVGLIGAIAAKSSVGTLAGGGGTAGAWKALTSSQKPGPPAPPPTP